MRISVMCRVLGVSKSGYYGWVKRIGSAPTGRAARDLEVLREIQAIHEAFRFYGSPRVHRELVRRGIRVGRHHVARLMRVASRVVVEIPTGLPASWTWV
ncbi:IS3 family transposase, partial [Herbiconiux moechotypicola]|uniref:IS3 family transposase n=1 Tax=Herbiconiux moechotypicola TaxID=637393 RepID=UPI00217CFE7A